MEIQSVPKKGLHMNEAQRWMCRPSNLSWLSRRLSAIPVSSSVSLGWEFWASLLSVELRA